MITANITAIDQRVVLGARGRTIQNYVVIELPGGAEVRAPIDEELVKHLMVMDAGEEPRPPQPHPPAPKKPSRTAGLRPPRPEPAPLTADEATFGGPEVEEPSSEAETVKWMSLPDSVLSPAMKAAFTKLEVAERLNPMQVRGIEREVNEKFGPDEWEEVLGPNWSVILGRPAQPSLRAPATTKAPAVPIGEVAWADGSPMLSGTRPSRTVPKNEYGYPVLNDGSVDPGEVVGGSDRDEDGIGQL